jgi:hypothetical protein
VYLGGVGTDDTLDGLYASLAREAGLDVFDALADVEVVRLRTPESDRELLFLLNHSGEERTISIRGEPVSHLDGALQAGSLVLGPYGVALLEPAT